jgi:SAM-dependent methyltransferase
MLAIYPMPADEPQAIETPPLPLEVMLASGQVATLAGLTAEELHRLQWEQEQKFARAIAAFPARSPQRGMIVGQAYDTISAILIQRAGEEARARGEAFDPERPLVMGFDKKYVRLALDLLNRQVARGEGRPRLFEIGYGSGVLLKEVRDLGFEVGGIEVSVAMRERAARLLGDRYGKGLLLGDFRDLRAEDFPGGPPSLVYWNDVLEHLPVDEAAEYVAHIHKLLAPRGQLVTITPNWIMRPSDVTGDFCPPRTEARGLHLKEYRLKEVVRMLRRAGFRRVGMPLGTTPGRVWLCGGGGRRTKQLLEPVLDRLPVRPAQFLCRGFALSCTIATK